MDEELIVLIVIAIVLCTSLTRRFKVLWRLFKDYKTFKNLKVENSEHFFLEIDKAIETTQNKRMKALFQLQKSVGLMYKGPFEESIALLTTTQIKSNNKLQKMLNLNNLLYSLLLSHQLESAKRLIDSNPEFRKYSSWNRNVRTIIKNTVATYEFYLGDLQTSRTLFNELSNEKMLDDSKKHCFFD